MQLLSSGSGEKPLETSCQHLRRLSKPSMEHRVIGDWVQKTGSRDGGVIFPWERGEPWRSDGRTARDQGKSSNILRAVGCKGWYLVVSQEHVLLEGRTVKEALSAENTSEEWPFLRMGLLMLFQGCLGRKGLATHFTGISAAALSRLLLHGFR